MIKLTNSRKKDRRCIIINAHKGSKIKIMQYNETEKKGL